MSDFKLAITRVDNGWRVGKADIGWNVVNSEFVYSKWQGVRSKSLELLCQYFDSERGWIEKGIEIEKREEDRNS